MEIIGEEWSAADQAAAKEKLLAKEQEILADPERDYFDEFMPRTPKAEVGKYVASQGFPVPLIENIPDWQAAFDAGKAMIRSELPQDYDGLSGLLSSVVIEDTGYPLGFNLMFGSTNKFRQSLNVLVAKGLRSGELQPSAFMDQFIWNEQRVRLLSDAGRLGVDLNLEYPEASTWKYIQGTNIRIFRDPTVDGRYQLGIRPQLSSGEHWRVDPDQYDQKHVPFNGEREVEIAQVIEFYERIRTLPRFDQRQAALMEMQMDEAGHLHFLQYLKTGHVIDPVEAFVLPEAGENSIMSDDVRGATSQEGWDLKLYIDPKKLREHMRGQAFFIDWTYTDRFAQQMLSVYGSVVVNDTYIVLKDNHYDSAPIIKPKVGMSVGFKNQRFAELSELSRNEDHRTVYIDAHITANGRDGVIESDWVPQYEDLD